MKLGPEISSVRFIKNLPLEEIAPYVQNGQPYLVRGIPGRQGVYQRSGPWRASAYVMGYGLKDGLVGEQFDRLAGILDKGDLHYIPHKKHSRILITDRPIWVVLEVHASYPITFEQDGFMDYSGWATVFKTKRLPLMKDVLKPASATLVLLSKNDSIARSGLVELLERHGFEQSRIFSKG